MSKKVDVTPRRFFRISAAMSSTFTVPDPLTAVFEIARQEPESPRSTPRRSPLERRPLIPAKSLTSPLQSAYAGGGFSSVPVTHPAAEFIPDVSTEASRVSHSVPRFSHSAPRVSLLVPPADPVITSPVPESSPAMEESVPPEENRLEDSALVASAQKGNTAAFDSLVLRHTGRLYGLVFHMTSSHEDTDDLLQEIWAKVYRSLSGFRGASRFSTWVHSIAVHMTLNFLKRRNRRATVSLDAPGPAAAPGTEGAEAGTAPGAAATEEGLITHQTPRSETHLSELQTRLTQALEQLSPEHRAVVTLFDIQGMAHSDIARIMGVSEGTVRSRLFYAHRQLQSLLSDMAEEFFPSASAQTAS